MTGSTPDKVASNIEDIILEATTNFSDGLEASQQKAFNRLMKLVKDLDLDSKGRIKRTVKNLKTLRGVNKSIEDTILTPSYKSKVQDYLGSFDSIGTEQSTYFKLIEKGFSAQDAFLQEIKAQSIETASSNLLETGISQNFTTPIKNILQRNITTGGNFASMVDEMRTYIIGDKEIDGGLLRYAKGITKDSLHVYSGQYNQSVTEDLGLVFYKYSGGLKDSSRDFCESRAGKYFHKEEIKTWASKTWDGKMKGTTENTIFQNVGGYGCTHLLIPVSESIVPKDVIERARKEGYK